MRIRFRSDREYLYRPQGSTAVTNRLLEQPNVTNEDVEHYINYGRLLSDNTEGNNEVEDEDANLSDSTKAYRKQRLEMQELMLKYYKGQARLETVGQDQSSEITSNSIPQILARRRLVDTPPLPPQHPLPPLHQPPPPPPGRQARNNVQNNAENNAEADPPALTLRRIFIAVLTVVAAFVCILFQTLPIFNSDTQSALSLEQPVDPLVPHLVNVKPFLTHVRECTNAHRDAPPESSLMGRCCNTIRSHFVHSYNQLLVPILSVFITNPRISYDEPLDCSLGVVHIPALSAIMQDFARAKSLQEIRLLSSFVQHGVDITWPIACTSSSQRSNVNIDTKRTCFRGVHDDVLDQIMITQVVKVGSMLVQSGYDHYDIHSDTDFLLHYLEQPVEKIKSVVQEKYSVHNLEPFAFRIQAVGPIDGAGVPLYSRQISTSSTAILGLLNMSNYIDFLDRTQDRNTIAKYSLPWPLRWISPKRDVCNLLADTQVDAGFELHTMVYLSDGAGQDYRGGSTLYVDDHKSNNNPRGKIQRGILVDGTVGRLVVSTGGLENRRCRLPMRAGVRATLQVWWKYDAGRKGACDASL